MKRFADECLTTWLTVYGAPGGVFTHIVSLTRGVPIIQPQERVKYFYSFANQILSLSRDFILCGFWDLRLCPIVNIGLRFSQMISKNVIPDSQTKYEVERPAWLNSFIRKALKDSRKQSPLSRLVASAKFSKN